MYIHVVYIHLYTSNISSTNCNINTNITSICFKVRTDILLTLI